MLRLLCLSLLLGFGGPVFAQPRAHVPQPVPQEQVADLLWQVMDLDRLAPILQSEAVAEGQEMAASLFPRGGTGLWLDQVRALHHPDRVRSLFLGGVSDAVPRAGPREIQAGLAFYRTGLGQRILTLEGNARDAMLDDKVETAARAAHAQAMRRSHPRAARIALLIDSADLIEPNVAGGLNASIAFARGFEAGGGFPMPMPDAQIIQDAWAQEPQMRMDTEAWIGAYLFLAYASLSDSELDLYIRFAASEGGRALSRVMFAGFDATFARTSRDMGLAAAAEMRGREL